VADHLRLFIYSHRRWQDDDFDFRVAKEGHEANRATSVSVRPDRERAAREVQRGNPRPGGRDNDDLAAGDGWQRARQSIVRVVHTPRWVNLVSRPRRTSNL